MALFITCSGGWAGKSAMVDATETTVRPAGNMTLTQVPAGLQPVKNYSYFQKIVTTVDHYYWKFTVKYTK